MKSPVNKDIILASNSPRRRQLLKEIVPSFAIAPSRDVNEVYSEDMSPEEVAPFLSRVKANAYSDLIDENTILITADTVVILEGKILGKPHSESEAIEMLREMVGKEHLVITGVTLKSIGKTETFSNITKVVFDEIPDEQIIEYVREFKPFDKAGSYGIQEWVGCRGIKAIEGCFYNVMGLPLNDLYNHLSKF